MTPDRAAEICEAVAEVLVERGHIKGNMYRDQGYPNTGSGVCLLGAGRVVQKADLDKPGYIDEDFITAVALGVKDPNAVILLNDGKDIHTCKGGLTPEEAHDFVIQAAKDWRNK
jgi:hypothetical protein